MTLEQFFRLAGLTTLILGTGLVLFPNEILAYFDGERIVDSAHFIRFLGTALIGFSVLNWYAIKLMHNPEALLIALVANFTSLLLASTIDLLMLFTHMLNTRSLLIVLLHISFALAFAYWIHYVRQQLAAVRKQTR